MGGLFAPWRDVLILVNLGKPHPIISITEFSNIEIFSFILHTSAFTLSKKISPDGFS